MIIYYEANGRIVRWCSAEEAPDTSLERLEVAGIIDPSGHYVSNSELVARPGLDLPQAHSLQVDEEWLLPGVPADTVVTIDGVEVGTADGGPLLLSFPVALTYQVELRAPFPWKPHTAEVTVNAPDT